MSWPLASSIWSPIRCNCQILKRMPLWTTPSSFNTHPFKLYYFCLMLLAFAVALWGQNLHGNYFALSCTSIYLYAAAELRRLKKTVTTHTTRPRTNDNNLETLKSVLTIIFIFSWTECGLWVREIKKRNVQQGVNCMSHKCNKFRKGSDDGGGYE